ncbi:MAG: phospholipase C, phosphocholine-specific [Burkholderiales bacterium]|nr:phospholipase C, phosphocholine-specific [Burkholderiales bacterium]
MRNAPRAPASGTTRRRFLGNTAAAALTAAANLLPPNLRRALAQGSARARSLRDIEHVVLLMQENRSFDHYFGTLAGVRGFADRHALALPGGRSVFQQPDPANPRGYVLPFHLDTRTTSAQKIPSTNHSWKVQHAAWNNGRMDRWVEARRESDQAKAPFVMGYHTRADLPFHYALADAFTICDAYHCSVLGPTWPNRMYWMTGTIDADGEYGGPMIANKKAAGGFRWTTYAERLERAGVTWKVYQQADNYGCNVLEYFQAFQQAAGDTGLYRGGMLREPAGTFEDDAMHGRLPAVSWLIPTSTESEHPDFMPAAGAAFIASKLDAIAARPEVWAKTAFILSYDENDGLFDHVAPPVPPPGTPGEFVHGLPIGAGFRVPCIVVSPWTTGGWVCSEPFDHTSVLRFLEKWTGVAEPNIGAWRRQTFGDLTAAFRFAGGAAAAPELPDAAADLRRAQVEVTTLPAPALPGDAQAPPVQETGKRRRAGPPA